MTEVSGHDPRSVSVADVRGFVLGQVTGPLRAVGLNADDVSDDLDLLVTGVLDSLGLIELVTSINERFDVEIDFLGLAVEDLGVIGPFCRYVAEQVELARLQR